MVPMFALLVAAVGVRRGRTALHHLAFSFHAIAALLACVMISTVLVGIPLEYAAHYSGYAPRGLTEAAATGIIVAPFFAWLALALRGAYGDRRVVALVKAAALTFGFGVVVVAYRALLFFTAFWAT